MGSNLFALFDWFLGTPPEGYEGLKYVLSAMMGFFLFDFILDIFRFIKRRLL